jgi:hypothetical protein
MKIRLTRKFADQINGIDLSKAHAGETLDLSEREARMLMAEGWAEHAGGALSLDQAHEAQPPKRRRRRANQR